MLKFLWFGERWTDAAKGVNWKYISWGSFCSPASHTQLPYFFHGVFSRNVKCSESSPCSISLSISTPTQLQTIVCTWTVFVADDLDYNQKWANSLHSTLWCSLNVFCHFYDIFKNHPNNGRLECTPMPSDLLSAIAFCWLEKHKAEITQLYLLCWYKSSCSYSMPSGFLLSAGE